MCWDSRDSGGVAVEIMAIKPSSRELMGMDLLRIWIDNCAVDESVH